jgi:hypothetical protein
MAIIARERTADTEDRCRLASGVEVAAVMNSSQVICPTRQVLDL